MGDYGRVTSTGDFLCEGNIFSDLRSLALESDIAPRQLEIHGKDGFDTDGDYVTAHPTDGSTQLLRLHKPLGILLPNNQQFNSLLDSLSTRLTNRYLVTKVVQNSLGDSTHYCSQNNEWECPVDSECREYRLNEYVPRSIFDFRNSFSDGRG